eukprot:jgi/Botrbrau1/346/Bobra.110_2s0005.1
MTPEEYQLAAARAVISSEHETSVLMDVHNSGNLALYLFLEEVKRRIRGEEHLVRWHSTVAKAAQSVKSARMRMYNGTVLLKLPAVGPTVVAIVEEHLWSRYPPPEPSEEELAIAAQLAEEAKKAKKAAAKPSSISGHVTKAGGRGTSTLMSLLEAEPRGSTLQDSTKGHTSREKKGYRPLVGTANYAFMICLLQAEARGQGFVTKSQLMDDAEQSGLSDKPIHGDKSLAVQNPRNYFDGWSNFKRLVNNDPPLAIAYSNPKKLKLTEEGKVLARELYLDAVTRGKMMEDPNLPFDSYTNHGQVEEAGGTGMGQENRLPNFSLPPMPGGGGSADPSNCSTSATTAQKRTTAEPIQCKKSRPSLQNVESFTQANNFSRAAGPARGSCTWQSIGRSVAGLGTGAPSSILSPRDSSLRSPPYSSVRSGPSSSTCLQNSSRSFAPGFTSPSDSGPHSGSRAQPRNFTGGASTVGASSSGLNVGADHQPLLVSTNRVKGSKNRQVRTSGTAGAQQGDKLCMASIGQADRQAYAFTEQPNLQSNDPSRRVHDPAKAGESHAMRKRKEISSSQHSDVNPLPRVPSTNVPGAVGLVNTAVLLGQQHRAASTILGPPWNPPSNSGLTGAAIPSGHTMPHKGTAQGQQAAGSTSVSYPIPPLRPTSEGPCPSENTVNDEPEVICLDDSPPQKPHRMPAGQSSAPKAMLDPHLGCRQQEHLLARHDSDVIDLLDSEDEAPDIDKGKTNPPLKRSRLTSSTPQGPPPGPLSHVTRCIVTTLDHDVSPPADLLKAHTGTPFSSPSLLDRLQNILVDIAQGTAEGVQGPYCTATKPSTVPLNNSRDQLNSSFPARGAAPTLPKSGLSRNASTPVPYGHSGEACKQALSRNSSAPLGQGATAALAQRAREGTTCPPLPRGPAQLDKTRGPEPNVSNNAGLRPSRSGPCRAGSMGLPSASGGSQPSMGQWASSQRSQSMQLENSEADDGGDGSCFSNIWRLPGLGGDWGVEETDIRIPPLPPGRCFDDEFDIVLVLDMREQFSRAAKEGRIAAIDRAVHVCQLHGVNCEKRTLGVGDVIWIARSKNDPSQEYVLDYVIERKSVEDLATSIQQKRYDRQKYVMHRSGLRRPIYLSEGDPDRDIVHRAEWAAKAIRTALVQCEVIDGFMVLRTESAPCTKRLYADLTRCIKAKYGPLHSGHEQVARGGARLPTFQEFQHACVVAKELTVRDVWGLMLTAVDGVGPMVIDAILRDFPTPLSLYRTYQEAMSEAARIGRDPFEAACAVLRGVHTTPGRCITLRQSSLVFNALFRPGS